MLSELEFEGFKDKVMKKYKTDCVKRLKQAEIYRKEIIKKAREEGEEIYRKEISRFLDSLKNEKNRRLLQIQLEAKREINKKYTALKEKIIKELKNSIEADFEQFVLCFSKWLDKNFETGTVKTEERYADHFKKYTVETIGEKKVIFSYQNIHIELSPEKIVEDYRESIEILLNKLLKGK